MSQDALDSKIRKWNSLQGRRFGSSRKTVVDAGKQQLPPEALRRIIKDHGDMR
jgi:pre-mRNA-processing factor 8